MTVRAKVLVDTSIWIDHLHAKDPALSALLRARKVLVHPFIIGEVALGSLRNRDVALDALVQQPRTEIADPAEVLRLIMSAQLYGVGIGYVDAHLLASVKLTEGATLWSRDKRLAVQAERLGVAADVR